MIHLARLSEGKELPPFQHLRSTKALNKFLNAWGKIINAETLLDEKYVCCMYGKATFIGVNQLRYDSFFSEISRYIIPGTHCF